MPEGQTAEGATVSKKPRIDSEIIETILSDTAHHVTAALREQTNIVLDKNEVVNALRAMVMMKLPTDSGLRQLREYKIDTDILRQACEGFRDGTAERVINALMRNGFPANDTGLLQFYQRNMQYIGSTTKGSPMRNVGQATIFIAEKYLFQMRLIMERPYGQRLKNLSRRTRYRRFRDID